MNDCPVASFKKYQSKLSPECDELFQTPKTTAPIGFGPWYKKTPVGKILSGNMMATISKKAGLSKLYTNHCVRATCITILDAGGFASRDICQVSRHNNEGSLASYTGHVSNERKYDMSSTLAQAIGLRPQAQPLPRPPATLTAPLPAMPTGTVTQPANVPPTATPTVTTPSAPLTEQVQEQGNFDVNFDLGLSGSQSRGSLFDFEIEDTDVIQHELTPAPVAVNAILQPIANNQHVAAGSRITTSSSRSRRMQVQQSPFVFNNCTVTINYFKD